MPTAAGADQRLPLAFGDRARLYYSETLGPGAVFRSGFVALMNQRDNDPPEWRQGTAGYSRRLASRFARHGVQESIEFGAGALLREDPRYFRAGSGGFWRRTGHAIASTLLTRTAEGGWRPAFARLGGIYGGAMISTAWYPSRYSALGDGIRLGTTSVGVSAAVNVLREFWPSLRSAFRR